MSQTCFRSFNFTISQHRIQFALFNTYVWNCIDVNIWKVHLRRYRIHQMLYEASYRRHRHVLAWKRTKNVLFDFFRVTYLGAGVSLGVIWSRSPYWNDGTFVLIIYLFLGNLAVFGSFNHLKNFIYKNFIRYSS